jgi:Zinc carboxypeptidase
MVAALASLYRGFREKYLSHRELTEQCRGWAEAYPELCRLESIGTSGEGRELWLLTMGPEPERTRPAVWIDGNIHAAELAGSSAALGIAEDVLALHLDPTASAHGLPAHIAETLRDVLFYVLPRMSPDGAEAVLETGRWVRSVPRDDRAAKLHPRWVAQDLDGDGLALLMRKRDPGGEFVESNEVSGLLLQRRLEDEGPFFKLYPEGVIEGFDGHHVPDPDFLSDNFPDLNRNFPFFWAPDPEQAGGGTFPGSEPESRAVIERAAQLPHLFAWLAFHTFGGVFIRPLGNAPDKQLDPMDRAVFAQIGEWAESITGYPMVSGFEEFTYREDHPLHGDLSDFAYHHRGCISYVCELWDLFRRIGMARPKRFCDHYTHMTREDVLNLARWDARHNASRIYRPWRSVTHPQLGAVEVGGFDPRVGLWNPPYDVLPEICAQQSAAFLRVAAMAPRLRLAIEGPLAFGDDVRRLDVTVENIGYLPTHILASARALGHNEELWVELSTSGELSHASEPRQRIGHLEGWGRGLRGPGAAMHAPRSRGSGNRAHASFLVRGHGTATLRVASARVGKLEARVRV